MSAGKANETTPWTVVFSCRVKGGAKVLVQNKLILFSFESREQCRLLTAHLNNTHCVGREGKSTPTSPK